MTGYFPIPSFVVPADGGSQPRHFDRALRAYFQGPCRTPRSRGATFGSALSVTAVLFTAGKFLIGLYLGTSSVASSFGAAGALILVLVWVYYSTTIFLLGAEFTKVFAERYGSGIRPAHNACFVSASMRSEQGLAPKEEAAPAA